MSYYTRLNKSFEGAIRLPLNYHTKYALISDCHRGTSTSNDNFLKNQNLYYAALQYYYKTGYTYIELGDGDELWENRCMKQIIETHHDVFHLLSRFRESRRLYMLYGNHDIVKKNIRYTTRNCSAYPGYMNNPYMEKAPLLPDILRRDHSGEYCPACCQGYLSYPRASDGSVQFHPVASFAFPCQICVETVRALWRTRPYQRRQKLHQKAQSGTAPAPLGQRGGPHPDHRTYAPADTFRGRSLLL